MAVVWIDDEASYRDFIQFVMTYAPDRFPVEDYLADDEQLTLEQVFHELRDGLKYAKILKRHPQRGPQALELLQSAHKAYVRADRHQAINVLQEFEILLGYDLKSWLTRS